MLFCPQGIFIAVLTLATGANWYFYRCAVSNSVNTAMILRHFGFGSSTSAVVFADWPTLRELHAGLLHAVLLTYFRPRCDAEQKN